MSAKDAHRAVKNLTKVWKNMVTLDEYLEDLSSFETQKEEAEAAAAKAKDQAQKAYAELAEVEAMVAGAKEAYEMAVTNAKSAKAAGENAGLAARKDGEAEELPHSVGAKK